MSALGPFVAVPRVLWLAVTVVSVITAVVRSFLLERRPAEGARSSVRWDPFGLHAAWTLPAAAVGYGVGALFSHHFGWGDAARSIWWSMFAASALAYAAQNRLPGPTRWIAPPFAALGALLFGPLTA